MIVRTASVMASVSSSGWLGELATIVLKRSVRADEERSPVTSALKCISVYNIFVLIYVQN
jgi:hypothetical protein